MAKASKPQRTELIIPASGGEIKIQADAKLKKVFDDMIGNLSVMEFGQIKTIMQSVYEKGLRDGAQKTIKSE